MKGIAIGIFMALLPFCHSGCTILESLKSLDIKTNLRKHLIGHWKMDTEGKAEIPDDSGSMLHGKATNTQKISIPSVLGKFSRARRFSGNGGIRIPNKNVLHFGTNSFSFTGWANIENYDYPMTNLAVQQGFGCYFQKGRVGASPGWDIGHGFSKTANGTEVCIRDHTGKFARKYIYHNDDAHVFKLLGMWTHYGIVFDRYNGRAFLYINGKRQDDFLDISQVTGAINNDLPLTFGTLHGWKTTGIVDDYRLYNTALLDDEMMMIYSDHTV